MRTIVVLLALFCPGIAIAQITSSLNLSCTVVAPNGMGCNGIGVAPMDPMNPNKGNEKDRPTLSVTEMNLAPGAFFESPNASSDLLVLGVSGGDLLNEKTPFRHVPLERDSVSLMPKGTPFRLRNDGSESVQFRLIES